MKRIWILIAGLLALSFLAVAFAQTATPGTVLPSFDFKAWGSSVAVFAGILAALVSLLKARLSALTGWRVLLLAFGLSELGAFLLYSAGWLTDQTYTHFAPPYVWLLFGLVAWVIASGGYNLLMQLLLARPSGSTAPIVVTAVPQVLHPLGTPGTEPLHNLQGDVIGAVKPLTPSQPRVSGDEALR